MADWKPPKDAVLAEEWTPPKDAVVTTQGGAKKKYRRPIRRFFRALLAALTVRTRVFLDEWQSLEKQAD